MYYSSKKKEAFTSKNVLSKKCFTSLLFTPKCVKPSEKNMFPEELRSVFSFCNTNFWPQEAELLHYSCHFFYPSQSMKKKNYWRKHISLTPHDTWKKKKSQAQKKKYISWVNFFVTPPWKKIWNAAWLIEYCSSSLCPQKNMYRKVVISMF